MKKILTLLIVASTLISCSSSDDDNTNPNFILEKVVFYKNSPNERHWNIINDLLTTITLPDGTVVEEFVYDSQKRVVRDIKYANGAISENTVITYNAENIIQSINGLPYTYNASTQIYAYSYGSDFTIDCKVNDDFLAVDFTRNGVNPGEYHMTYSNGNMTSFEKVTDGSTDLVKNFHFYGVDFTPNPIFNAVLAVARVKSLTDPNFFIDYNSSRKIPDGFDKGSNDPFYYNYGHLPKTESQLYQVGIEVLDSNNNFVEFYSFADYYYTAE